MGYPRAMMAYGHMIEDEHPALALDYLKRSADYGYYPAINKYAYYLEKGIGIEKMKSWHLNIFKKLPMIKMHKRCVL